MELAPLSTGRIVLFSLYLQRNQCLWVLFSLAFLHVNISGGSSQLMPLKGSPSVLEGALFFNSFIVLLIDEILISFYSVTIVS